MAVPLNITPPNLPVPSSDYVQQTQSQFTNILRLFFNTITNAINFILAAVAQITSDQTGSTPVTTVNGDVVVTGSLRIGSVATSPSIYSGSGAPSLSAAKGSLYLRLDGTTTNNRAYINTNGSTTWTAVITVI